MPRTLCLAVVLAFAVGGCSSQDDAKPNPDLPIPNTPPGRGAQKDTPPATPAKSGKGPALPR